jgi:2-polyprenyl-6-methoxyphenol hydroxylase-like FAD-dependent oxidoreductase
MDKQTNTVKTQVLIVGAGPTGLSMAVQLLRYNIDFIIIERNEKTTHLSKAIAVQARTLEIFQELGIVEKALQEGQMTTGLNLFYKGKRKATVNLAGLGKGLSPFPFALSLEQSKTEKLLVDYLSANQKFIQWKSDFTHFQQDDNGVTAYYKDSAGQEQKVEASYLVGCDGASSVIRHQLDLSFEGDTVPKIFYVADVRLKSPVINKNELFMFLIKKGFILFFPMEGRGHYRIVGILPDVKDVNEHFKFTDIDDDIKLQVSVPLDFEEVKWFSSYKVHSRKANSFAHKRCFIAGDAAHIHTPAGGQGMNTGIQDAYNLAWKIAYALRKEITPKVLATYDTERSENAKRLLQTTDRIFEIMAGTSAFWNFIRLNFIPGILSFISKSPIAKKRVFPLISQTAITYSHSDLTIESSIGQVRAGVRMPFFTFSNGKQIFDYLTDPAFKILVFGNGENNSRQQLSSGKIKMVPHAFREIPSTIFGDATDFYILLRPDNHISYIGYELDKCRELLNRIEAN